MFNKLRSREFAATGAAAALVLGGLACGGKEEISRSHTLKGDVFSFYDSGSGSRVHIIQTPEREKFGAQTVIDRCNAGRYVRQDFLLAQTSTSTAYVIDSPEAVQACQDGHLEPGDPEVPPPAY